MSTQASPLPTLSPTEPAAERESWTPMIAIALGQAIMSFNVAALPVSLSGMAASFGVPPTTVGTGIVMYSLAVAGFVMLGAKLVQCFGFTAVFRVVVAVFGAGQVLMTFSPTATRMLLSQLIIGLAAAVNVPALVALIANHYHGQRQATAIGALGSARAGAGVAAFLIGGMLGTFIGWRPVFGLLVVVCAIVFLLSLRLKPEAPRPEVRINMVGVVNYDIHAARFVRKSHTALLSAFASPLVGPIGAVVEGRPRLYVRPTRLPWQPSYGGPPRPVALLRWAMGEDGRLLKALPSLGYAGAVIEGMGAGHVPAEVAPLLGDLAARMPVVLATCCMAGPVFSGTYGYAGGEIDLIGRGLIPAGILSGLKARLLLGFALRNARGQACAAAAFAPYQ